ncbi:hypothetical protein EV360DRAFT_66238 [Lentinula raphanica]|nr:hypothetical protein EV360DRAFT_66238 [Lentinula raphanica]
MLPEIPLQDYFDYILPRLPKRLKNNIENVIERQCPRVLRSSSSRPDAFFKACSTKLARKSSRESPAQNPQHSEDGEIYVYDIANLLELNDFSKLVHGMKQIGVLALDPCRRFTLGATLENRTMRLCFLSRATLLRTTPFDLIKARRSQTLLHAKTSTSGFHSQDHRQLIRYFLSLAFSSPTGMGWDPTIMLSHKNRLGHRRYNVEVDGQTFTTMKPEWLEEAAEYPVSPSYTPAGCCLGKDARFFRHVAIGKIVTLPNHHEQMDKCRRVGGFKDLKMYQEYQE